ncbi:hypothetical protein N9114_00260, partial [Akkermansiaceae bacterium]|nr:hypothetical protein [Akkermansiaceae bacterium]
MFESNITVSELALKAKKELASNFRVESTLVSVAPGRVNLIGEHIDYCDGFVLPLAIERYVGIAARPNDSQTARISTTREATVEIDLSKVQEIADPKWSNYLRGIIRGFQDLKYKLPGFDASIVSSV